MQSQYRRQWDRSEGNLVLRGNPLIHIAWIMAASIAFVSDSHEECDTVLLLTDLASYTVPDSRFRKKAYPIRGLAD